ncbi:MAG: aminopeptidase [Firmicutes bacterium]|nr:aminopeptidase [Bacillota bacterium]
MLDPRLVTLAKQLVNYSVAVKPGDKVLITCGDCDPSFVACLVDEVYLAGGMPITKYSMSPIGLHVARQASEDYYKFMFKINKPLYESIQCSISCGGELNKFDGKSIPPEIMKTAALINKPFSDIIDKNKVRWVGLDFPNPSVAQEAKMETEEFEDYFFEVCNFDYAIMDKALTPLAELMLKADRVRVVAPDTDLTFSIKGQLNRKCVGHFNIPDGEIFTSPIKNSVNGKVKFNVPLNRDGKVFTDIELTFKNGKVVKHNCSDNKAFEHILNTDKGSRYVGEFAFGINPHIKEPMVNTLFDEKISGSWHMALGKFIPETPNGNESAIHMDMVQIQTPEYGGGEIYFDDKLIRKDGKFVLKELKGLNAEILGRQ